jgi:hypothetical protein
MSEGEARCRSLRPEWTFIERTWKGEECPCGIEVRGAIPGKVLELAAETHQAAWSILADRIESGEFPPKGI